MAVPPPLPEPPRPNAPVTQAIIVVLAGVILLGALAMHERQWVAGQPWTRALITPDMRLDLPDALTVWARQVPHEALPENDPLFQAMEQLRDIEGAETVLEIFQPEHILALELDEEALQPLLLDGRLPEPGQPELLAGPLARFDAFTLDSVEFTVVGRLKPAVSGFVFAYLLPLHEGVAEHFTEAVGATEGSLLLDGMDRIDEVSALLESPADTAAVDAVETSTAPAPRPEVLGGQAPTRPLYAMGVFLGLVMVALGGAVAHQRLFLRWKEHAPEVFQGILQETLRLRGLFVGMHALFYGIFFGSMLFGLSAPLLNYWIIHYIGSMFRDGALSYIGDAYASGDILMASLTTFYNNYVVQTLLLTFALSFPPLALGVLKTVLSFLIVGFAMAPHWIGTASGMTFHSITIALELEAYIVACFAVVAWATRLFSMMGDRLKHELLSGGMLLLAALLLTFALGLHPYLSACFAGGVWSIRLLRIAAERALPELVLSLRMLVGAMVLTGVMLAIAAVYEATTIILFRPLL